MNDEHPVRKGDDGFGIYKPIKFWIKYRLSNEAGGTDLKQTGGGGSMHQAVDLYDRTAWVQFTGVRGTQQK